MKLKFLVPLLAFFMLTGSAFAEVKVEKQNDPTEQVAAVSAAVQLEVKESLKLDDAEFKSAVATPFSNSNALALGIVSASLLGIFAMFADVFRKFRNQFTLKNGLAFLLFAAMVTVYFLMPQSAEYLSLATIVPIALQIKTLKDERGAKLKELDALVDTMTKEARAFNADEQKKYEALKAEVESYSQRIAVLEEKEKRDLQTAAPMYNPGEQRSNSEEKELSNYSFLKVARAAANRKPLDGLEAEMNQEAEREMRTAGATPSGSGYAIPLVVLRNTKIQKRDMTATGGTSTEGGFNVATETKGYIEALVEESRVISLGADYVPGAVGNISMPRENAVYTAGWKNGENATTDEKNPTYTAVTLTPKRLGGFIDVSNQLLAQTAPGFEARIRRQIMNGQANGIDAGAINGAGSSGEPTGILQTSGIGSVVGGTDGAAPDRDDLVDLWKAVGVAKGLRGSLHYLSNPQVFAKLAKTKTDTGSGFFVLDQNKSFMGYNFAVSTNVPSTLDKGTATGVCSAIIFGNFQDLMITQWGGVEILVDPYTQALTGLTRMVVNTFTDLAVLRPASFAAMKDALTS